MRLGRPKVALILTDDERVRLDSLAHRSLTAPHLARRARIILACAEGRDNNAVAKRLRMSPTTVCKWRGRFVRERLDGLYDEPRPGGRGTCCEMTWRCRNGFVSHLFRHPRELIRNTPQGQKRKCNNS